MVVGKDEINMEEYKIEVYLPLEALDEIIKALRNVNVNNIGNYDNCMSWYKVKSCWDSNENANPYKEAKNETSIEDEYKLEFRCKESKIKEVVNCIKNDNPKILICSGAKRACKPGKRSQWASITDSYPA